MWSVGIRRPRSKEIHAGSARIRQSWAWKNGRVFGIER